MSDEVYKDIKGKELLQEEIDELLSYCGPALYRITRDGGAVLIYHCNNSQVIMLIVENIDTMKNIRLYNKLSRLLREYEHIHCLEFTKALWQEYNKQPADCFLEWIKEEHPEEEPFEAEYIGPEMKDSRTKFGLHIENGVRIYYN